MRRVTIYVHDQTFFIEWVLHFCQKSQAIAIGHTCDESRQTPNNRDVVKVVKKSTIILPFVPEQTAVEQTIANGVVGGRPQGETANVEEGD